MSDTNSLGRFGEACAAEYLRQRGFEILERNYRTRLGEIDIIARGNGCLVFAEVKLRKSAAFAEAREFVTPRKQQRVIYAAEEWLQSHPTELQPRFDVLEVYAPRGADTPHPTVKLWENAFGVNA